MSEWKVTASHRSRAAVIYVRQSTLLQVERNRESTARQYDLASRARELGWPPTAVTVIDEDLGLSGASAAGHRGPAASARACRPVRPGCGGPFVSRTAHAASGGVKISRWVAERGSRVLRGRYDPAASVQPGTGLSNSVKSRASLA